MNLNQTLLSNLNGFGGGPGNTQFNQQNYNLGSGLLAIPIISLVALIVAVFLFLYLTVGRLRFENATVKNNRYLEFGKSYYPNIKKNLFFLSLIFSGATALLMFFSWITKIIGSAQSDIFSNIDNVYLILGIVTTVIFLLGLIAIWVIFFLLAKMYFNKSKQYTDNVIKNIIVKIKSEKIILGKLNDLSNMEKDLIKKFLKTNKKAKYNQEKLDNVFTYIFYYKRTSPRSISLRQEDTFIATLFNIANFIN